MENLGFFLQIFALDDLRMFDLQSFDVLILSKCQDCRSLLLAQSAKASGLKIGLDLFDDYFSQKHDPRFAPQRIWLRNMARNVDFFLCSTPRMLEVAREYLPSKEGHVLSDPCNAIPEQSLAKEIEAKVFKIRREKQVRVLWFGIASNPSFPVGLRDLVAFSDKLLPFAQWGYQVSLTILTNAAGIDPETFDSLRRLPVPFTLLEWSEVREAEALKSHFVSFLPVNYQPFSAAKSMNRGISALSGGTQLLTAGHPTYRDLERYAYQDANALIDDLEQDTLKLSPTSLPEFADWMRALADPATEAGGLAAFLAGMRSDRTGTSALPGKQAVLHGSSTTAALNRFLREYKALSLATPLIPAGGIKCDAHLSLDEASRQFSLRVSSFGLDCLPDGLQRVAAHAADASAPGLDWTIAIEDLDWSGQDDLRTAIGSDRLSNAASISLIRHHCRNLFQAIYPQWDIVNSELDAVYAAASIFDPLVDPEFEQAEQLAVEHEDLKHV